MAESNEALNSLIEELEMMSLLKLVPPKSVWFDPEASLLVFNYGEKDVEIATFVEKEP